MRAPTLSRRMSPDIGFSFVELAAVLAIMLVVGAMAAPSAVTTVANLKLRTTASTVAGIVQSTRMTAVKDDRSYTMRTQTLASGGETYGIAYIDLNGNGSWDASEPMVQLPVGIRFDSSGANPAFDASSLIGGNFTAQLPSVMPSFNARGLPCIVSTACNITTSAGNAVGFLYFLRYDTAFGARWAAVSVAPAGRIRTWQWNGSKWN